MQAACNNGGREENQMSDRSGAPLFVHVAVGVALGVVLGGVTLYALWSVHTRRELAEFNRQLTAYAQGRSTTAVQRARPAELSASSVQRAGPCEPGETLGRFNDESVCVSPSGRVTPARR